MVEQQQDPDRGPEEREEEVAAYERLRAHVKRILGDARETVNTETLRRAVDEATVHLRKAGRYTGETVKKAGDALKRDLASTAEKLGPRWEALSDKTADLFDVWRDRSAMFLGQASTAVSEWLRQLGERLEHQTYRTGDMTYGGTFKCARCGEHLTLPRTGHVPPCPNCAHTEFRRV